MMYHDNIVECLASVRLAQEAAYAPRQHPRTRCELARRRIS